MKAKIEIDFVKVGIVKLGKKHEKDERFREATKKTLAELCKQIEHYFKDKKIKAKANFELE